MLHSFLLALSTTVGAISLAVAFAMHVHFFDHSLSAIEGILIVFGFFLILPFLVRSFVNDYKNLMGQ